MHFTQSDEKTLATTSRKSFRKEVEGFAKRTQQAMQRASAQINKAFLEIGACLTEVKSALNKREYTHFLREKGMSNAQAQKYLAFYNNFAAVEQSAISVEPMLLMKLCSPRYKEVVQKLKVAHEFTQELVERLLAELKQQKKVCRTPYTGWKQTKNGRYYNVILHDENTGIDIEAMAQEERITRQRVIAEAIALRKQQKKQAVSVRVSSHGRSSVEDNFNTMTELELHKTKGHIYNYANSGDILPQ